MPQAAVSIPVKSLGKDGREWDCLNKVNRIKMASLTDGADNDGIGKQFSSPSNVKNVDTDGARKRGRHASNAKDSDYENSKPNTPPHEREPAASQQLFTSMIFL